MEPAPSIVPLAVPRPKGRTVTAMDFRNQGGVKCYTYNDNGKYYLVFLKVKYGVTRMNIIYMKCLALMIQANSKPNRFQAIPKIPLVSKIYRRIRSYTNMVQFCLIRLSRNAHIPNTFKW
jgi:hypothetical protein